MTTPATKPVVNGDIPSPFLHTSAVPKPDPTIAVQESVNQQYVKVPLSELMEEEPQSKSISFKKSSDLEEHISRPTVKVSPDSDNSADQFAGKTTEELRTQMINEELQPVEQMSPEDFGMIAGFLIDAWDLGTVTLLRMYAMDKSDTPYEMTGTKKTKLKNLLTLILIRFNKKFPLGMVFLFTIILTHITPALKAHAHRKEVQELNKKKPGPKKGSTNKSKTEANKNTSSSPKTSADVKRALTHDNDNSPGVVTPEPKLPKKSQGAQSK